MITNKVLIKLDIWAGPIWGLTYNDVNKKYDYYIQSIVDDEKILKLHQEIQDLYSSYYIFTESEVITNEEQERKDKYIMLDLLDKLIIRLDELNDGSFEIDDRETDRVSNL